MSFASGITTIVVATDLKGQSQAALEYARKLAAGYGARIVLAYGLDPVDYAAIDAIPGPALRTMTDEARTSPDSLRDDLLQEGIHTRITTASDFEGEEPASRLAECSLSGEKESHEQEGALHRNVARKAAAGPASMRTIFPE